MLRITIAILRQWIRKVKKRPSYRTRSTRLADIQVRRKVFQVIEATPALAKGLNGGRPIWLCRDRLEGHGIEEEEEDGNGNHCNKD